MSSIFIGRPEHIFVSASLGSGFLMSSKGRCIVRHLGISVIASVFRAWIFAFTSLPTFSMLGSRGGCMIIMWFEHASAFAFISLSSLYLRSSWGTCFTSVSPAFEIAVHVSFLVILTVFVRNLLHFCFAGLWDLCLFWSRWFISCLPWSVSMHGFWFWGGCFLGLLIDIYLVLWFYWLAGAYFRLLTLGDRLLISDCWFRIFECFEVD